MTEIAKNVVDELRGRSGFVPLSKEELALLDMVESAPASLEGDFGSRVNGIVAGLDSWPGAARSDDDEGRERMNEALHVAWIGRLRPTIGPVIASRKRVAILIDNLDKGWERSADLNILSALLLGLLGTIGRVERDLTKGLPADDAPSVSLALFLRSDIFAYLKQRAREPDKIVASVVEWADNDVLRRVVEERFLDRQSRNQGRSTLG